MARPKGSKDKKPRVKHGNTVRVYYTCKRCGVEFCQRRLNKNPLSLCKKCIHDDAVVNFKKQHPGYTLTESNKAKRRSSNLRLKYNMTMIQYDELLKKQNNVCAICKKPQIRNHSLCVDHNHDTGIVRGLRCHKCNQAIGLLHDKGTFAAQYLLSNSKISWDDYFMNIAVLVSSRSKDRSTKVGSVIVKDRIILSTGYNGFPRGVNDDLDERHERPLKYQFTCHSEENAIFNAARIGAKIDGSDIYVTLHPCTGCAKAIIQSQIKRVFILNNDNDRWIDDFCFSASLLKEAGVNLVHLLPSGISV